MNRMKRLLICLLALLTLMTCAAADTDSQNEKRYNAAWQKVIRGDLMGAKEAYEALGDYRDSAELAYLLGVCEVAEVTRLYEDVYVYEFHGFCGLINLTEHKLVLPQWNQVEDLGDGLLRVSMNGRQSLVNTRGDQITGWYYRISDRWAGYVTVALITKDGVRFGMLTTDGETVTPAQWTELAGSSCKDGKLTLTSPESINGACIARDEKGRYSILNRWGEILGGRSWDEAPDLQEQYPVICEDGLYGYADPWFSRVIIEPQYEKAQPFRAGCAAVMTDGRWQYIDTDGKAITPAVYTQAESFRNGMAHVKHELAGWQVIDRDGKLLYFVTPKMEQDYQAAVAYMKMGEYAAAANLLAPLTGYEDATALYAQAKEQADLTANYKKAQKLLKAGRFGEAEEILLALGDYRDAPELAAQVDVMRDYYTAKQAYEAGDYAKAAAYAILAGDYRDAAKISTDLQAQYEQAVAMAGVKETELEAYMTLLKFRGYKDADQHLVKLRERIGNYVLVETIGDCGFRADGAGWYVSENDGSKEATALCRITFLSLTGKLYVEIGSNTILQRNAAVSWLDMPLTAERAIDEAAYYIRGYTAVCEFDVPDVVEHTIYIRYTSDTDAETDDEIGFRVRFEEEADKPDGLG